MPQVSLAEFVAVARSGDRLLSFPTDTVPALAARPDQAELIYIAKQRSQTKPLILMGAEIADLWPYITGSEAEKQLWQQVIDRYWPGALTLVLPASDRLPPAMNPTDPTTIGIRIPDHAIARHILAKTGPLATTSANQSGQPPLQTLAEIESQFPQVLTLHPTELARLAQMTRPPKALADASSTNQPDQYLSQANPGIPSTVAKWTGTGWQILRQGAIQL
jgi:L-threonylcarbamoyladenylate synthase